MRPTHYIKLTGLLLIPIALAVVLSSITAPKREVLAAVDRYIAQERSSTAQPKGESSATLQTYTVDRFQWVNKSRVRILLTKNWQVSNGVLGETTSLTATYENGSWHVRGTVMR